MYDLCSNSLYHHGIKGQRWGVRRFQNYDGTYTALGKKRRYDQPENIKDVYDFSSKQIRKLNRKVAVSAFFAPVSIVSTIANANSSRKAREFLGAYNPMKTKEIVIPEGTEFKRMATTETEKQNRRMYVSYGEDKASQEYYSKIWPEYLKKFKGVDNVDVYEQTYKVNAEIRAPSLEKRKQIVKAMLDADKAVKTELGKQFAVDQMRLSTGNWAGKKVKDFYSKDNPNLSKEKVDEYVKKQVEQILSSTSTKVPGTHLRMDNFRKFTAVIPTSDKLMKLYIKELKKQGFNAVFDDNSQVGGVAPFIVFDPKMLTQTEVKNIGRR